MYDDVENDEGADGSDIVVGAGYEIAKDVLTYVEYKNKDRDGASTDDKLTIGARVYF